MCGFMVDYGVGVVMDYCLWCVLVFVGGISGDVGCLVGSGIG